mgnify:FL=1
MMDFLDKLFDALGSDEMFYFICIYLVIVLLFSAFR